MEPVCVCWDIDEEGVEEAGCGQIDGSCATVFGSLWGRLSGRPVLVSVVSTSHDVSLGRLDRRIGFGARAGRQLLDTGLVEQDQLIGTQFTGHRRIDVDTRADWQCQSVDVCRPGCILLHRPGHHLLDGGTRKTGRVGPFGHCKALLGLAIVPTELSKTGRAGNVILEPGNGVSRSWMLLTFGALTSMPVSVPGPREIIFISHLAHGAGLEGQGGNIEQSGMFFF
jgi:hypothetical protein